MPCCLAAALILIIHRERKRRFLTFLSLYAYPKPFSTVFLATVQTFDLLPKLPLASFNTFFLLLLDATAFTDLGILLQF